MSLPTFTVRASLHAMNANGGVTSNQTERTVTVQARNRHAAYMAARREMERLEAAENRPTGFALTFLSLTRHGDKRPWLQLTPGSSYRGADMGRGSAVPLNPANPLRFHLMRVRLDSGGYDAGGAYWGYGTPLYRAISAEETETKWGARRAEMFTRAASRGEAKRAIRQSVPGATFHR